MSCPPNFDPQPAGRETQPAPAPPRYLKHQIYADPRVFKHIDDHAINEARTNYRNFKDLIWNLIYKKNFNDLEKVRAIFRWMTTKNMYTIMFDSELPGSPEAILGGFKDGGTTYARIFEALCVYAGLHCMTLSGWAKGVEYRPGNPITSTPINHSWNAVNIDGNWQLVDSHWATRYLQSERNTPENLVYEYDDFYFLSEPSNLIYSHCPEDPAWQLLYPARSRAEFEDYPLVKSYFFNVGMQFQQQNMGVLHTRKGILVLSLGFTRPTAFTFKLGYGDACVESVQGIQLKRYVIQETGESRVSFYLRSPKEGNYYLTIYAQAVGEKIKVENIFKAVCEYKVVCEQAAGDTRPYPVCSDSNWGPGAPVRQYGLVPSHKDAILMAPNGRAEVSFAKTRDVRLYAKLTRDGMDEDTLERCVNVREQDDKVYVTIQLPARGEYGLEIYANEPDREGDTFTHVCQYLASYIDRDPGTVYGQVFDKQDLTYGQKTTMYDGKGRPGEDELPPPPPELMAQTYNQSYAAPPGSSTEAGDYRHASPYGPNGYQGYQGAPGESPYGSLHRPADSGHGHPGEEGKKGVEVVYVPGGRSPYGSLARNQGGKGGKDGQPGGKDGYPGGKDGYPGGKDGYPGGKDGYPGGKDGYPGGKDGYPGNKDGQKGVEVIYSTTQRSGPPTAPKPGDPAYSGRPGDQTRNVPGGRPGEGGRPYDGRDQYDQQRMHGSPYNQSGQPPHAVAYRVPGQEQGRFSPYGRGPETGRASPYAHGPEHGRGSPYAHGPEQGRSSPYTHGPEHGRGSPYAQGPEYGRGSPYLHGPEQGRSSPYGQQGRNSPYARGPGQDGYAGGYPPGHPAYAQQDPAGYWQQPEYAGGGQVPLESYPFGSTVHGSQFAQRPSEPEQEYKPHEPKVYTTTINIEPPTSFKPVPITQDESAPKPVPPPVPPKPFKDTRVFQDVDTHAVEVSKEEHKSFRELVWHLIYARDITNELEKARAIFLWLCSKDLTQLNFNDVKKGSPEEILMNLQRGQTTYAVVYETLCSYAGLHCKTISGYAKGAEYKPGMRFTGEQGQHSWNGVVVEGAWRLVDCHWAARRLVGKKVTPENVRYELDEYYFMPDPHQLIFTHFPDDSSWQLLERPITLTDFENLVPVKSAFFKYGLQILSHREAVIHTNREVTIRIGCPPFKSDTLAFTFTLSYDDGREEYKNIKLNRFGMQEMLDNVSFFTIRPPEPGSYRLILYAKDLTQQSKEGVYGGVCEYEVIAEGTAAQPQPFPPCVHTSWGPGDSAHKYNIHPLQRGAIFSTVNGQAEVKFRLPKDLRFTAKLKSDKRDEKSLSGYIMHRVVNDLAIFTITAPDADEYGLEIYANNPEADGNSLYHAFQYLLICTEVKGPVEPLPTLPPGYLGPQPNFKKLGLTNTSHTDPYLQTDSGDLQVSFGMAQPLRMTSQLIYVSQGKNEDFSDYLLQQGRGNNVIFRLKLPKVGMYKFQIYALPFSDTSESLPGVYNYLINCRMTHSTLIPFPKQYGQWKEGCFLHEPLEGQLEQNRPSKGSASSFQYYYYKVDVPKANSVAVVVGDDWTQLEQKGSGSWEGEVFMEKHWGKENKAALCANYGTTKASYSTLLEYAM